MPEPTSEPDCRRPGGCLRQRECLDGLCDHTAPVLPLRWPDGQPANPELTQQPADFGHLDNEPGRRPQPEPGS